MRPFLGFNHGYKPFPSPQQRAEERRKEAIASLASEISSDLTLGEIRKVYTLPSQGLALVFSDSVGNRKIDPSEWIYQKRGRRFLSLAIAPSRRMMIPLREREPGPGLRSSLVIDLVTI